MRKKSIDFDTPFWWLMGGLFAVFVLCGMSTVFIIKIIEAFK